MGVGLCGDIRVHVGLRGFSRTSQSPVRWWFASLAQIARRRWDAHRFLGWERVTPQAILEEAAERTARSLPRPARGGGAGHDRDQLFRARQRPTRTWGWGATGGAWVSSFIRSSPSTPTMKRCWVWRERRFWTRPLAKLKRHRHKRRLEDKESMRWIEAAQTAAQRLAAAAAIVMVGDRENDIYQGFTRRPPNVDLITRARSDRRTSRRRPPVRDRQRFPPGARNRGGGRPRPAARARRTRPGRPRGGVVRQGHDRQTQDRTGLRRSQVVRDQRRRGARNRRSGPGQAARVAASDHAAGRDGRGRLGGHPSLSSALAHRRGLPRAQTRRVRSGADAGRDRPQPVQPRRPRRRRGRTHHPTHRRPRRRRPPRPAMSSTKA